MTDRPKICPYCNSEDIDVDVNPIFAGLSSMEAIMTDISFWKCKCKGCGKKFGVDMLGKVRDN
jgi:transposase-like protein